MTDLADLAFPPSSARGRHLDDEAHRDLRGSLHHVASAIREHPEWQPVTERVDALCTRLSSGGRFQPVAFGHYFSLVEAVLAGDAAQAAACAERMDALPERAARRVVARGHAGELDAVLDERDGPSAARFHPVSPEVAARFEPLLDEGMALLAAGLPELHGEIEALVHEVLVAQAQPNGETQFEGASHYQFWGLLLLNPTRHRTRLAVAEVLAHEAGHSLLFGLTRQEPLVHNPDEELYPSPLRADPRPMDGIYHATFVSARMTWAMDRLVASDVLTPEERDAAREAAAHDRRNFVAGLSVVRAHGRLSDTGAEIMANAEAAMAA